MEKSTIAERERDPKYGPYKLGPLGQLPVMTANMDYTLAFMLVLSLMQMFPLN